MVLVNKRREIFGIAFLWFFMDVGLRAVLLKGPIVSKHVIGIYEGDWKHLLNDRACHSRKSLNEIHLCRQTPKLFAEIYIFAWDHLCCAIYRLYSVIDSVNVEHFLVWKQNIHRVFFSKICSSLICKLHLCSSVSNTSSVSEVLDHCWVFSEH